MYEFGTNMSDQPLHGTGHDAHDLRPAFEVAHSVAGRLRIRVTELREQPELAERLVDRLAAVAALQSFEVNPRSNSVILHFEPDDATTVVEALQSTFPGLADELRQRGGRSGHRRSSSRYRDLPERIAGRARRLNEEVEAATGGIDLNLLIPVTLLLLASIGLLAGAIRNRKLPVPAWYDLLWFAFNTFVILNLTWSRRDDVGSENPLEGT
jgi:hypothetical protein